MEGDRWEFQAIGWFLVWQEKFKTPRCKNGTWGTPINLLTFRGRRQESGGEMPA